MTTRCGGCASVVGPHRHEGQRAISTCPPTRWSRSASITGCTCRWESSATIATYPCTPDLVDLIAAWQAAHATHIAHHRRLLADDAGPVGRDRLARMVQRVATRAGVGHVHPHRLRHTVATQAINRGMRLEAVAALLCHKSLEMTLAYARTADRTVAEEYFDVSTRVDRLYSTRLPADAEGPNTRRLRQQHHRMLGNGWCERPAEMDCHYETICETCTYYATDPHLPVLLRQRDHARDNANPGELSSTSSSSTTPRMETES